MVRYFIHGLLALSCLLLSQGGLAGFYVVNDTPPTSTATQKTTAKPTNKTTTTSSKTTKSSKSTSKETTTAKPQSKSKSTQTTKSKPKSKPTSKKKHHAKPKHKKPKYSYVAYTGSLRHNVERMVRQSHWGQVVWNLHYDYRWVGRARLQGNSLQAILQQLLAGYPVQAVFYKRNHVVAIHPRPVISYHAPASLREANTNSRNKSEKVIKPDPKDSDTGGKNSANHAAKSSTTTVATTTTQSTKGSTHA